MYNGLPCNTFPHDYYNTGLHNSNNITTNHLKAIPFGQARGTIYKGSLLSYVLIKQTNTGNIAFNRSL